MHGTLSRSAESAATHARWPCARQLLRPLSAGSVGRVSLTALHPCLFVAWLLSFGRSAGLASRVARLAAARRLGARATGTPAATLHACYVADWLRAQLVTSSRSGVAASPIFKVRSDAAPLSSARTDGGRMEGEWRMERMERIGREAYITARRRQGQNLYDVVDVYC